MHGLSGVNSWKAMSALHQVSQSKGGDDLQELCEIVPQSVFGIGHRYPNGAQRFQ
jgi:hypothetical protein